jgi:hypothetical protein
MTPDGRLARPKPVAAAPRNSEEAVVVIPLIVAQAPSFSSLASLVHQRSGSPVMPFLVGTVVGGIAGGVAGTLLSKHTVHLVAAVIATVDRRLSAADRDELRFELLLQ